MNIRKITTIYILAFFLLFFNLPYVPNFQTIRYGILVVCGLYIGVNYKLVFRKLNQRLNLIFCSFLIAVVFLSYLDRNVVSSRDTFLASIVFAASLGEFCFITMISAAKNDTDHLISTYYRITLLLVCITDFLALTMGSIAGNYFVGTKFSVCYLHVLLMALYDYGTSRQIVYNQNKYVKWVYMVITAFIAVYVGCMSGLLGTLIYYYFSEYLFQKKNSLRKGGIFCLVLLICCSFLFVYEMILNNSIVQKLVTDIFNRKLTLTGRTNIYAGIIPVLMNRLWIGYGYGSAYIVTSRTLGYADTQNGLAQWVLQIGLIGTALLMLFLFVALNLTDKRLQKADRCRGLYGFIYMLAVLASIEITVSRNMLGVIAILYAIATDEHLNRVVDQQHMREKQSLDSKYDNYKEKIRL